MRDYYLVVLGKGIHVCIFLQYSADSMLVSSQREASLHSKAVSQWLGANLPDSKLAPSQWETTLQSNAVSYWLGANLDPALQYIPRKMDTVLLCSVLFLLFHGYWRIYWYNFPIFSRTVSTVLWLAYDLPSAKQIVLKHMGKMVITIAQITCMWFTFLE